MPPEVEVSSAGIPATLSGILYCPRLAMIFGVASLAKLIALPSIASEPDPFTAVFFVVVASVSSEADDETFFYNNSCAGHGLVQRQNFCQGYRDFYERIMLADVFDGPSFRKVGVLDVRH